MPVAIHSGNFSFNGLNPSGVSWIFSLWPITYDKEEVKAIKEKVSELKNEIDVLLVCGIGGSYLGARAAIEAINGLFPTNDVEIIYVVRFLATSFPFVVSNKSLKILKAIDVSVVVPDFEMMFTEMEYGYRSKWLL